MLIKMFSSFNILGQVGITTTTSSTGPIRDQFKANEVQVETGSQDQVSLQSQSIKSGFDPKDTSYSQESPATSSYAPSKLSTTSSTTMESQETSSPSPGELVIFNTQNIDLNNPLAVLEPEQTASLDYTDRLSNLNVRYPGLTVRLKTAEARAWIVSNTLNNNNELNLHTKAVLNNPPWPNGQVSSSREKIQNKAQELQLLNPKLASNRVEDYNFEQAQDAAEDLFVTISDLFPETEFEGVKFATRAKTPQSLETKLAKRTAEDKNFSLAHLTDSVGARIDCRSLKMLGDAANKLEQHFEGKIVAKDDYLSHPGELGYRALHYVVDLGDRMAEIQFSTHDLRATDLATHDTLYKPFFEIDEATAKKLEGSANRVMEAESFRYQCGYR